MQTNSYHPSTQYCLYLRKSRADAEAEARGEGETLARHEKALIELARRMNLNVTHIYREIVSGESIAARPEMQKLLQAVEQGIWAGVLVMEVERLARGDTIDQGIVAQTFKFSDTKIITPVKTYDPNNEYDEEYFEFGLFMSRREYKTINRRLQRGRLASVHEGKYVGSRDPYGYRRVRIKGDKGYTLEPVENEAAVIRQIFDWYANGEKDGAGSFRRIGICEIVRRLNGLGIKTKTGGKWTYPSIRDILANPIYVGKIRWAWRKCVKQMKNGEIVVHQPRSKPGEYEICDGLHPALVSEETWDRVQELYNQNTHPRPGDPYAINNPLSGILVCGMCGRKIARKPQKNGFEYLYCPNPDCRNVSSSLPLVERRIIGALGDWLEGYRLHWGKEGHSLPSQIPFLEKSIEKAQKDIDALKQQANNAFDFFEQGIYDKETFFERNKILSDRIAKAKETLQQRKAELESERERETSFQTIIPKVEHLLEVYDTLSSPQEKNDLLKDVLEKVVYLKEKGLKNGGKPDSFEITLYPKIPRK